MNGGLDGDGRMYGWESERVLAQLAMERKRVGNWNGSVDQCRNKEGKGKRQIE